MYAQQSKIFNNHSNRPEHLHNSHIRPYDHNKNHRHLHTHNFLFGMNVFLFFYLGGARHNTHFLHPLMNHILTQYTYVLRNNDKQEAFHFHSL